YRRGAAAPKLFAESGYSTLERVWGRPTFEGNGLLAGFTGEGAKTVIPAVAMAEVSMALAAQRARARVGPADVRGERAARRLHGRRREDGDSGGRDGEGQHAARARSGSR